jgi:hypothetical protein
MLGVHLFSSVCVLPGSSLYQKQDCVRPVRLALFALLVSQMSLLLSVWNVLKITTVQQGRHTPCPVLQEKFQKQVHIQCYNVSAVLALADMRRSIARCALAAPFLSTAATQNAHYVRATRQQCILDPKMKLSVCAYQDTELLTSCQVPRAHPAPKTRLRRASKMNLVLPAAGEHCH